MSRMIAVNCLTNVTDRLTKGADVSMVTVNRYNRPQVLVGVHIVTYEFVEDHSVPTGNWTVGLFSQEDVAAVIYQFGRRFEVPSVNLLSPVFTAQSEELQAYIRRQVVPLEWKSLSAHVLDGKLSIHHGLIS